jgi:O-antigen/teichoic acid export membrane protein
MADNNIYKIGLKNVQYSILAQGTSFILSVIIGFFLPKFMGVTQYGYWQVYLLYVSYVMIFCFGFNDGLYLRYGRYNYEQLPFKKLRSTMRIFIIITALITCFLFILSFLEKDPNKVFAFCATSINLLILGINGTLLSILLFTNRIKLNSILTIANKAVFAVLLILILLVKWIDFRVIIAADILTKLFLLGVNIYKSKELFKGDTQSFSVGFEEYKLDVIVGVKLMVANILSLLLIGIGRFIVERFMPIDTYSRYSFAVNITLFALVFISASSLSLYPLLKRVSEDNLPRYYLNLNILLCAILFILLAIYYPLYYLIKFQFKNFIEIFEYLYLLFIIIISQGKMQFLNNTYYKALREEKAMLLANLSGVGVALIIIIPAFYFTRSILSIVIGTTITLIWRCYASEIYLKRKMGLKKYWNIASEMAIMAIFIASSFFSMKYIGFIVYILSAFVYIVLNRKILITYTKLIIKLSR